MENNAERILIIGASILQLPAIIKAKEMGFYVGVVDYNPNAVGIKFADRYFNVSTVDIEGIVSVTKAFQPKGIMTLATDMPMRAIAAACEACDLPGISYETAVKATDKAEMIKAFEENNVEHPRYYVAKNKKEFTYIRNEIEFPTIIKPTDNAGSRGVVQVNCIEELDKAFEYSYAESRTGSVIIEECLHGPEFSVEVMVIGGVPKVLQITDKQTTGAPYFVETGHSQPSRQSKEIQDQIKELAVRAVNAVGINMGPAHVEIILTKDGPKMVELGARMGGDCIATHLVPLSTGIDMVKATIEMACGQTPDINEKYVKGAAIRYFNTSSGVLREIKGLADAKRTPGIRQITLVNKSGDHINSIRNSADRIGFVIAQADSAQEAISTCEKAMKKMEIVIDTDSRVGGM